MKRIGPRFVAPLVSVMGLAAACGNGSSSDGVGGTALAGGTGPSEGSAGSPGGGSSGAGGLAAGGSGAGSGGSSGSTVSSGGATASGGGGAGAAAAGGVSGSGGSGPSGPLPGLVGWASTAACGPFGTTGGEGGPTVTVQTLEELTFYTLDSSPRIVQVSGTITLDDEQLIISHNKTLIGLNGAELVGAVRVDNARNVVLKNLRFNGGPTTGDGDAAEVSNSTCVWIDHCEFFDGEDGNLDIVRGSDRVTVSWSRFYYVAKNHSHRLSNLCGQNDDDTPGKINVTFHHNWWGAGVISRMPRVRHGQVHLFNNYYASDDSDYCIGAAYESRLLVENNVFDGVNDPIVFQEDDGTAEVVQNGNDFSNATGERVSRGSSFTPAYPYTLDPAELVEANVTSGSGVN